MSDTAKRSALGRLYHGETAFDFYGLRRRGFVVSLIFVLVSLVSLFARGVDLGLDFEGGVAWQVPATATMDLRAISLFSATILWMRSSFMFLSICALFPDSFPPWPSIWYIFFA